MAITRAQQARQMLQEGNQVLGPLGEDDLQTDFVSGAKRLLTPGNIGRAAAFILSGGASSAAEVAKEIAKQKILNEIQNKAGDVIGPRIQTKLMQQQNEARGTGGYQSSFADDSDFMGGSGTAAEMGSFADGGRIGLKGGADASQFDVERSKQKTPNVSAGGASFNELDDAPSGDDFTKAQENIGKSKLKTLKKEGVPKSNLPGVLGLGLNATEKLRDFTLRKNIEYFEDLSTSKYPKTLEGYTQYMQDRSAGLIDAAGNPKTRFDDNDSFTPVDTTFAQAPTEEEVLSPIQQAILDRGTPSAFLANGGMPKDAPVGGIMDLESGRQMYFLGKLVKKATRAVKKIVKSPIGKAALFAAPFLMNPALRTGIGTFLKTKAAPFLFEEGASFAKGNIGFGELLKGGLTGGGSLALGGALTLAPLLFQEDTNDDEYQKFLRERGAGAQLPAPIPDIRNQYRDYMARAFVADGGTPEPVAKKTMPLLDMDGKEMDLRAEGGFVPIGRMEKADDVPARLSKNEFVFTADAVRNAGDGDVDKGAEVMYNMMKNLESGGDVSEESQGLEGARRMFQTSQRLEEVL
jgi:hypothetical protein